MPSLLLFLLLVPSFPGGPGPDATLPGVATRSPAHEPARPLLSVPRYAASIARPTALGARLAEIRSRFAPAPPAPRTQAPARDPARERRRQEMRPLPSTTLGALERRVLLGDRTFASAQDPRLGAYDRRLALSRSPPARPRGR
jgi:hypothetical protein